MDSRARFARAIDSQFRHLGRQAHYRDANGNMKTIGIIARRPEQLFALGDGAMHAENPQLEFRVSEMASPQRGDEIHLDDKLYRIEAQPRLDLHQLVWIAECLPLFS